MNKKYILSIVSISSLLLTSSLELSASNLSKIDQNQNAVKLISVLENLNLNREIHEDLMDRLFTIKSKKESLQNKIKNLDEKITKYHELLGKTMRETLDSPIDFEVDKEEFEKLEAPNHFQRNWLRYLISIGVLSGSIYFRSNFLEFGKTLLKSGDQKLEGLIDKLAPRPASKSVSRWISMETLYNLTLKDLSIEQLKSLRKAIIRDLKRKALKAAIPVGATALSYLTYKKLYRSITNTEILQNYALKIDQVLTSHKEEDPKLTNKEYGALNFYIHELKKNATKLKVLSKDRRTLLKDLDKIISENINNQQRKEILTRMYRFYKFLSPNAK